MFAHGNLSLVGVYKSNEMFITLGILRRSVYQVARPISGA